MRRLTEISETLPLADQQDPERLQAALVLAANGDYTMFLDRLQLAQTDWRDTLVGAGLDAENWAEHLDALLDRP